jgi:RIO kinase 1
VTNNVLAMDFVGVNGAPSRALLTSNIEQNDYEKAISLIKDLYHKAKLVHGDFSEYNIFKTDDGLVVFDLGSAVDLRHPNSKEFLKRDINNITRFFKKKGMNVKNSDNVFEDIVNEL